MALYTQRPKQRRASQAWDYFMRHYPALRTTLRALELGYSPSVDHCGPGWVMHVGHLPTDTLHWKGGTQVFYTVLSGNIPRNYL